MSPFSILRYLRHGPLQEIGWLWVQLGRLYRFIIIHMRLHFPVSHCIGPYGPFNVSAEFGFSDFANWGKGHNRGFIKCIEACRHKTCVLDIGAHIGLVTMPMSKAISPSGQVVAFEPSSANREALKRHLSLNSVKNVTVVDNLIGDEVQDHVPFYESSGVSGMNSCTPFKSGENYKKVSRPQTTIDEFCLRHNLSPEIIKIDVEGWELSVLEGSTQVLKTSRPIVFLSVHPKHLHSLGRQPSELWSFLYELDYKISDISGDTVKSFKLDEYILEPKQENAAFHP